MHLLYVLDNLRRFDAGTDYLYEHYAFLAWRHAEQKLPSGYLCATVDGGIGNWQITPFANRRFIANIDQLAGVPRWLDGQSGTRYKPEGLDVHHRSNYSEILAPPVTLPALEHMIERMNDFMREEFQVEVWRGDTELPSSRDAIKTRGVKLGRDFITDLLKLQAA